jgi:GTPase involved in cell partitioning and DNA repair
MVCGEGFDEFWKQLTDDQKLLVANHVAWINKTALSNMIKKIKSKELASMNMIQLRALGKKRGLIGFMQMSKSTLLSELSKLEGLDYGDEE